MHVFFFLFSIIKIVASCYKTFFKCICLKNDEALTCFFD